VSIFLNPTKIYEVEDAYCQYHNRIAILGGIDVDFICRSSAKQIYDSVDLIGGNLPQVSSFTTY